MSNLDRAFDYLLSLTARGVEYPDAEFRASLKFNVDYEDLREMYDNL